MNEPTANQQKNEKGACSLSTEQQPQEFENSESSVPQSEAYFEFPPGTCSVISAGDRLRGIEKGDFLFVDPFRMPQNGEYGVFKSGNDLIAGTFFNSENGAIVTVTDRQLVYDFIPVGTVIGFYHSFQKVGAACN